MKSKLAGVGAIVALVSIQFIDLWWLALIGTLLCVWLASSLERENRDLRQLLAQRGPHKAEQEPGLWMPAEPTPQDGDAFLQGLRSLGERKPASERKPGSSTSRP